MGVSRDLRGSCRESVIVPSPPHDANTVAAALMDVHRINALAIDKTPAIAALSPPVERHGERSARMLPVFVGVTAPPRQPIGPRSGQTRKPNAQRSQTTR